MANQPRSREKHVTGGGAGVHRRGSGLGSGPVGSGSFHGGGSGGNSGGPNRYSGGGSMIKIIILVLLLVFGGGGGLSTLLLGGSDPLATTPSTSTSQSTSGDMTGTLLSALLGGGGVTGASSPWGQDRNTGVLDTSVDPSARERYTTLKGDGTDQITLMV